MGNPYETDPVREWRHAVGQAREILADTSVTYEGDRAVDLAETLLALNDLVPTPELFGAVVNLVRELARAPKL